MGTAKLSSFFLCLIIVTGTLSYGQNKTTKAQKIYGVNLISNAGAEQENVKNQIPKWQPLPASEEWAFMNDSYGHTGGEWDNYCDQKCGLPPNAEASYFRFPVSNEFPNYALWQDVDLSMITDTLINRNVSFTLSGYIAGFKCDQQECGKGILMINFYDKDGKETGKYETSKDNYDMKQANPDDGRMRQFETLSITRDIPQNSIKARVTIKADSKPCCNSAYIFFDNLSFLLARGDKR